MVTVKDTNPGPIAEDFNAGRGAISGRLSARECAMNVLRFLGHLIISTFGVVVAAAVLTYSIVLPLHLFIPSLNSRTVHWILTETPYFPVQILVGLLWGFQLGRRYRHRAHAMDMDRAGFGYCFPYPVCFSSACRGFGG